MEGRVFFSLLLVVFCWSQALGCFMRPFQWTDGAGNQLKLADKCDFYSNDIERRENAQDVEHCGTMCLQTDTCTHFIFRRDGSRYCTLKKSPYKKWNAQDSPRFDCGFIASVETGAEFKWRHSEDNRLIVADDCDYPSNDLAVIYNLESINDCGKRCLTYPECTHFIWNRNSKACNLKKSPYKVWNAQEHGQVHCGLVDPHARLAGPAFASCLCSADLAHVTPENEPSNPNWNCTCNSI